MKKLLLLPLLLFSFSCSTDEMGDSDSKNSFLKKHDGTVWDYKVPAESDILDYLNSDDQFQHNYLSIHNNISQYGFSKVFMLFNEDIYYEIDEPDTIDNYCNFGSVVYTFSDFNGFEFNLIEQKKNILEWSYSSSEYGELLYNLEVSGDELILSLNLNDVDGSTVESLSISFEKVDDDGSLLGKLKSCDDYPHTLETL